MSSQRKHQDTLDIGFLVLSLGATLITLAGTLASALITISDALQGQLDAASVERWTAVAMAFLSLIGFYGIYFSGRRLFRDVEPEVRRPHSLSFLILIAFPLGLLFVYLGYDRRILPGLLTPLGHLITTATPVLAAVLIARWFGPLVSMRRTLGQFLLGLWAAPPIAFVLEAAALVPVSLSIAVGLSASPQGKRLIESLMNATSVPPNIPENLAADVFLQPWVLLTIVMFLSVIVPLVEETIKTVGLWPLLRRSLTPREAFLSGALSGSGYALFEALLLTQAVDGWLPLLVARGGASLMHAFTGAIGSWGISQGIYRQKWAHTALGFFGAVAVHGLWNLGAVGINLGELLSSPEPWNPLRSGTLGIVDLSLGLVSGLVVLAIVGLIAVSIRLRRGVAEAPAAEGSPHGASPSADVVDQIIEESDKENNGDGDIEGPHNGP
jgi:hypothetical protein